MFHSFKRGWVAEPWQKEISGKFSLTASTGAVVAGTGSGKGWAVTKSDTGEYELVFDTPVAAELVTHLSVQAGADNVDIVAQHGGYTVSTRTLLIRTNEAGTTGDVSAACTVHFTFKFQSVNVP